MPIILSFTLLTSALPDRDSAGATLVLVAINFIKPPSNPFTAPNVMAPFILGIATLVAFAVWEGNWAIQPIVPLKVCAAGLFVRHDQDAHTLFCFRTVQIFTNVSVDQIFILNASFGYVFYSSLYYIPEFFQVNARRQVFRRELC